MTWQCSGSEDTLWSQTACLGSNPNSDITLGVFSLTCVSKISNLKMGTIIVLLSWVVLRLNELTQVFHISDTLWTLKAWAMFAGLVHIIFYAKFSKISPKHMHCSYFV